MNTTLNFLSVPKESATSAFSAESTAELSGNAGVETATGRQGFADSGEKSASFANVLREESQHSGENSEQTSDSRGVKASEQSGETDADTRQTTGATISRGGVTRDVAEATAATPETDQSHALPGETTQSETLAALDSTTDELNASTDEGEGTDNRGTSETADRTQVNIQSSLVLRESIARVLSGGSRTAPGTELRNSNSVADDRLADPGLLTSQLAEEKPSHDLAPGLSKDTSSGTTTDAARQTLSLSNTVRHTIEANLSTVTNSDKQVSSLQASLSITEESGAAAHALKSTGTPPTSNVQESGQHPNSLNAQIGVPDTGSSASRSAQETAQQSVLNSLSGTQADKQAVVINPAVLDSESTGKQTRSDSFSVTASLESFPAAGKPLPPTGKSLPAGLFFQGEGDNPAFSQSERAQQATQPIDLNNAIASKQLANSQQSFEKGFEFNSDRLMRSVLGSSAPTAEALTPAAPVQTAPDSSASSTSLLNPLLQVTAEKTLQAARAPLSASSEPALTLNIAAQAGSAEWQSRLSGRIKWMGNLNISSAELKLHPAELGAVEIQITTEDDQTRVSFITSNAAAKEVIESTLPRLRELLSEGGLQLEQGDVAQRDLSDEQKARELLNGERAESEDSDDGEQQQANIHFTRKSTSQIDHYV
jgi:flagellar hook-length control protein FliK